jgi:hypothetical protein
MRSITSIITFAIFSPFCFAQSGVDIGADSSKDQKTSISSKLSREKSMSISQDQKSSRRLGSEKAKENRSETSRSKSQRSGTDRSIKNDTAYSLSVVNILLSTVAELENSEGNFKNCHLLSNSFTQKFPIATGTSGKISWVTNAGGITSPTLTRWLVNDLSPGFDQLRSYISCWLWYGEILAASLDDLAKAAEKGVYRNEKHVSHDAIVALKRNAWSRDIMDAVLQQTAEIETCSLPTGKGIENESEIRVLCGSIEIRPHEGIVMSYGTPLFNADSIKGRKLDIAIITSDSTHEGIDIAQDFRDSSSESSRSFNSSEQSTENGRSLSYRKSETNDQSISSDDDIRANETFKASPQ